MEREKITINRRSLAILALVIVWMTLGRHIIQLDRQFFQPSLSGLKGLVLYELGAYRGSALAYRARLQEIYRTGRSSGDPAWDALAVGDYGRAKELSEQRLQQDPDAIDALLNLGDIAIEEGHYDVAQRFFEHVLARKTDQFEARLLASVAFARTGRYGDAIDSLNWGLRTGEVGARPTAFFLALQTTGELDGLPPDRRPFCLLAHYHRYLRVFDSTHARLVKRYARKAIAAGDHVDDAYLSMAVVYDKEGESAEALNAALQAVQADPHNMYARGLAAKLYSDRGDLANEYQMMKAGYEAAPTDPYIVKRYSDFLSEKLGDFRQALEVTERSLAAGPQDPLLLRELGYLYDTLGTQEESLRYFEMARELDPDSAFVHEAIGYRLLNLGREEEAITSFQKSLELDSSRSNVYAGLGYIYLMQGKNQDAIQAYEAAYRVGDRSPGNLLTLCSTYYKAGEFQQAADCSNYILSIQPKNQGAAFIRTFAVNNLPRGKSP
jgi:tetratricopeptide (TPR) repeat protein